VQDRISPVGSGEQSNPTFCDVKEKPHNEALQEEYLDGGPQNGLSLSTDGSGRDKGRERDEVLSSDGIG